ncbi:zinc finger, CCHC-type containing protein [Tanacetum coccineum]
MDVKTTFLNGELEEEVDLTKEFLSSRISIKDIGEVDVILGIRIKHESNGIAISQSHYIEKVLKKFNYFDCTPVSTPIDKSDKLMPNNGQAVSQLKYSRVTGCLMYAMTCTRPDIAFAAGKLSRYTSNSGTQDWQAIQRVLKYLKKTMDYRLNYIGYPSVLEGYTDASWISNTEENSFTSGWVFLLSGGAIFQMYNGKSRHFDVRYSMIRELITNKVVSIEFVRSQQNLADHLTKGLARYLVIKSAEGMLCLDGSTEDEVINFSMVNFLEKVLSRSMNKEEPPMNCTKLRRIVGNLVQLWVQVIPDYGGLWDWRRWQKKMHFLLSSMSVVYVLTTFIPEDGENATVEQLRKRAKWDNDDYVSRGLILNGMSDSLFDIYQNVESSKELWDSLEEKYMSKEASSKKFLVSNFTNYKMTDSRLVLEQYNELLGILGRFTQHKMNMDESIQVSCIIDKLTSSWKDFKHTLKYLKKELTLVELGSHLRIEESLRMQDSDKPKDNNVFGPLVVNMVENNNSSRYNDNKGKRKYHDNTKADPNKKSKVTCWKCGKPGHLKKDCKGRKVGNKANSSGINGLVDGSTNSLKG